MTHETSIEIMARYCGGDEEAASGIFDRYVHRLTLLARSRLSPTLASRTDPEDVVLSAYRSFFIGARDGRFKLSRSGDLWRLLVSITMHKLYRHARFHQAGIRSVASEETLASPNLHLSREPSPHEALSLADELEQFMTSLAPEERRIFELRLQDETLAEISAATGRSERTVRRILKAIRINLASRLERDISE